MAGKKVSRAKNRKTNRSNSTKPKKRRPRRSRGLSFEGILTTGVRTLLGLLPGYTKIRDFVDFALTNLSVSTSLRTDSGDDNPGTVADLQVLAKDMFINGCGGAFLVSTEMLCTGSKHMFIEPSLTYGASDLQFLRTNYRAGRPVYLKLEAKGVAGSTAKGEWGIGFKPFTTAHTQEEALSDLFTSTPSLEAVKSCPHYAIGAATDTLILKKNFKPGDGFAYQPHVFHQAYNSGPPKTKPEWIGYVIVSWYAPNRVVPITESPTAQEFQPEIKLSGGVRLSDRDPATNVVTANESFDPFLKITDIISFPNFKQKQRLSVYVADRDYIKDKNGTDARRIFRGPVHHLAYLKDGRIETKMSADLKVHLASATPTFNSPFELSLDELAVTDND